MNTWNQNNNNMMGQAQFNPYMTPSWNQYTTQKLPTYHAEPIHGEMAAWQFPMAPNSEIYLPDANEDIIWWIRTDTQGNKTVEKIANRYRRFSRASRGRGGMDKWQV